MQNFCSTMIINYKNCLKKIKQKKTNNNNTKILKDENVRNEKIKQQNRNLFHNMLKVFKINKNV